jgi:hypothetical protein
MFREYAAGLLVLPAAGCSWLLDFSDQAIPRDAAADAPYSAAECAYKEPNDSAATAAAIAPGETGPAAICAGAPPGGNEDRDFYRFTVPPSTARVEIRIGYTYRESGDLDLRLYLPAGAPVESRSFTDEERIACPGSLPACPALAAGDYVFEVFPGSAGVVNRYTFAVAITAQFAVTAQ